MFCGPMMVAPSLPRIDSGSSVESSSQRTPFGSSLAYGTVGDACGAEETVVLAGETDAGVTVAGVTLLAAELAAEDAAALTEDGVSEAGAGAAVA